MLAMGDFVKDLAASYPIWARAVVLLCALIIAAVLTFARQPLPKKERSAETISPHSANTSPHTAIQNNYTQSGRDTFNIQGDQVTIIQNAATDTRPLKDQIREYLSTVNPEILRALDSGAPSSAVMINAAHLSRLAELQKRSDLADYLIVEPTGSTMMGAHNRIGGYINDVVDVGTLQGFQLTFLPRLRR
jgi:hypothetical protein